MVGTWLLCGKRWSLCGRYHGCGVDAVWEGMESVWTLSWFYRDALGRDSTLRRRFRAEGAQSLRPKWQHHTSNTGSSACRVLRRNVSEAKP